MEFSNYYQELILNNIQDEQIILKDNEIQQAKQKQDLGKTIETIHTNVVKEPIQNRLQYTRMLRKAVHQEAEIPVEEAVITHTRGGGGGQWTSILRENPDSELNYLDISVPFDQGEQTYLRDGEPFEDFSTGAGLNTSVTSAMNKANVMKTREALREEDISEERIKEDLVERYDKANDTIFVIPNAGRERIDGQKGPNGEIGFEYSMGEYLPELKKDKEFRQAGGLFLANHVGEEEFMHVGEKTVLEERYSNKDNVIEGIAEYDDKVFAATVVDEQTHQEAALNLYKPEEMVEN
jgi:hypothetical protein